MTHHITELARKALQLAKEIGITQKSAWFVLRYKPKATTDAAKKRKRKAKKVQKS
mgnify:CR=1 FL=1